MSIQLTYLLCRSFSLISSFIFPLYRYSPFFLLFLFSFSRRSLLCFRHGDRKMAVINSTKKKQTKKGSYRTPIGVCLPYSRLGILHLQRNGSRIRLQKRQDGRNSLRWERNRSEIRYYYAIIYVLPVSVPHSCKFFEFRCGLYFVSRHAEVSSAVTRHKKKRKGSFSSVIQTKATTEGVAVQEACGVCLASKKIASRTRRGGDQETRS